MIPKGSVNISQCRTDVGLPATGNLGCEELSDRARATVRTASGYTPGPVSTSALKGTVTSFMCRHEGPTASTGNITPPAGATPGKVHTNCFSLTTPTNSKQARLDPPNYTFVYGSTGFHVGQYDILAGLSLHGKTDGNKTYKVLVDARLGGSGPVTYRNLSVEVIGWSLGYYSGSAHYYGSDQFQGAIGYDKSIYALGSYPYLTVIVQALSRGGAATSSYSDAFIDDVQVYEV